MWGFPVLLFFPFPSALSKSKYYPFVVALAYHIVRQLSRDVVIADEMSVRPLCRTVVSTKIETEHRTVGLPQEWDYVKSGDEAGLRFLTVLTGCEKQKQSLEVRPILMQGVQVPQN